jgi:hypothetical protein
MVLSANSPQKVNALACNTRRFGLILCFLLGLTLSTAASPSTVDSHTDQIARDIIAQKKSFVFPKVLVIDFPLQTAGINALSSFLADDLSAALDAKLPAGTMIPRSSFMSFSLHRMSRRSICNLCLLLSGPPTNSEQTKSSPGKCRLLTKHST